MAPPKIGLTSENLPADLDRAAILNAPDVDGALVGGASLKLDTFLPIIEAPRARAETQS